MSPTGTEPAPFDLDSNKILTRFLDRKGAKAEVLNLPRPQDSPRFG
jgi:hypothetical protein